MNMTFAGPVCGLDWTRHKHFGSLFGNEGSDRKETRVVFEVAQCSQIVIRIGGNALYGRIQFFSFAKI
jgi:hypothetical protein